MTEMIRKQIYLESGLDRLVKKRAEHSGRSQAGVIRDALKKALAPGGRSPELQAWGNLKRFFEERATLTPERKGRNWKRNDLYEGRMARQRDG